MSDKKEKNIRRAQNFSLDRDLAMYDEVQEMNDMVETLVETLDGIDLNKFEVLKGEKGDIGEQGEKGQQGEKGERGEQGIKGDKGEMGRQGIQGKDGQDGRDGRDGKDGRDGRDGENGSSDTPEDIRNKLELLLDEERLDAKYIKNLERVINPQVIQSQGGMKGIWAGSANPFEIKQSGTLKATNVKSINFTGSGISSVVNNNGDVAVTISGGGGFTELVATGAINGSNTVFTFPQQPTYIVSDGVWYKINKGWTWSNPTATMSVPPSDDIYGVA